MTLPRLRPPALPPAGPPEAGSVFFALLATGDIVLILLHVAWKTAWQRPPQVWLITRDYSFGEMFQYAKEGWSLLLLGILLWRTGERRLLALLGVMAIVLADDALRIHEFVSLSISDGLGRPSLIGLPAVQLIEFVWLAAFGATLLVAIWLSTLGAPAGYRRFACRLGGLFIVLGLLAGGMDAVHALIKGIAMDVLEDGGELLVTSAIVSVIFGEALRQRPLCDHETV